MSGDQREWLVKALLARFDGLAIGYGEEHWEEKTSYLERRHC